MRGLHILLYLFLFFFTKAQEGKPEYKWEPITITDFNISRTIIDTSAEAIIIAESGKTHFRKRTYNGSYIMYYTLRRRVLIRNKAGYDYATLTIPVQADDLMEEKVKKIKAITYNLVDGVVKSSVLSSKEVVKEKVMTDFYLKKFTLPDVRDGCIIEYSYVISSEFYGSVRSWVFQNEVPTLWSEYEVVIPEYFEYLRINKGYHPFYINTNKVSEDTLDKDEVSVAASDKSFKNRWVMKDLPAFKDESFVTSYKNHRSSIEFHLLKINDPKLFVKNIMRDWKTENLRLNMHRRLGAPLTEANSWMDTMINKLGVKTQDALTKSKIIFTYVRDSFACTSHDDDIFLSKPLEVIVKNRKGTVADLNLLYIALLKHIGISGYPVILSTRSNGYVHEEYPIISKYNYLLSAIQIDSSLYFADVSRKDLGFNKMHPSVYNGQARLLANEPFIVRFNPDSIAEVKNCFISFIPKEGGGMDGYVQKRLGYFETLKLRELIREKDKDEYVKNLKKSYDEEVNITNVGIDTLTDYENPVKVVYDISWQIQDGPIIYINPMFNEAFKENLLKSTERLYPIEIPHAIDYSYTLNLQLPEGYTVEELPKSAKVLLNETDGFFEYMIGKQDGLIQLRSHIKIRRANFGPEEYNVLRNFFGYVVKKHAEQIVLKKMEK